MNFLLLLLLLLLSASACDATRASLDEQKPETKHRNSPQLAASPEQAKNLISTTALSPAPIQIAVADLPKPFASESASKSPNGIPIPQNPTK